MPAPNKQGGTRGGMLPPTVVKALDSERNGSNGSTAEIRTAPVPTTTGGPRQTLH